MTEPASTAILFPLFAMVALVFFVLLRMRSMRFAAARTGDVKIEYYRAYQGDEPEALRVVARHYANLFEMPVLFYLGVVVAYATNHAGPWMVGLAWAYVAARYAHSFVHLTSNALMVRFSVFFASTFILFVLWVALGVQLVRAG